MKQEQSDRISLQLVAFVFLTIVEIDAQQLCSSPMSVPGSKTNTIIIQNVSELTPPNTVLKTLQIYGSDAQIALKMVTVNENIRFNESSRELIVTKSFNTTDGNPAYIYINITCTAYEITTILQIVIQVYDMNNNPPWFTNLPYFVNISERIPVNTTVFNGVLAVDVDPSDRGYLLYSVDNHSSYSSYFSFPVSSVGNLVLMKTLEYDTIQAFNLTITVVDNGNNLTILGQRQPQHTATTSVLINVLPADDYNPVFNQSTYTGVLTIDTQLNQSAVSVQPISASVKYAEADDRIIYSVVQDANNAEASYFAIDNQTGLISTSWLLSEKIYSDIVAFQVQATKVNQSYRYGRALVRLNVLRTTKSPTFTQSIYSASLADASPNGTLVATVVAVGGSSNIIYYLNEEVKDLAIDSNTGEIRTTRAISYKNSSLYNLTVTANDSRNIGVCRVIVTVIKQNAYNPSFAQSIYTFNISKDTSFVGHIVGTDADPYSILSYRLIDTSSYFVVDNSGTLSCLCSSAKFFSNSTSGNTHSMMLIVADDVEPVRQASALVVVTWNTGDQPVLPVRSTLCNGANEATVRAYYIVVIVLGVAAGLFLIVIFILVLCLYRRSRMKSDPRPRVTIEVGRTPQKSQNSVSQGSRKSVNGFEVATEYGPYFAYGSGDVTDDVSAHSPSTHDSDDKQQKPRTYHGVPAAGIAEKSPTPNDDRHPGATSKLSNVTRRPPQHHHRSPPYSSTSIDTSSSPPSSRVERYRFEDDVGPQVVAQYPPKSASQSPRLSSDVRTRFHSAPGPRRDSRLQSTVLALADSNSGHTSSTETLVTPVTSRTKPSNVSFVENTGGYLSSQDGIDVSMSALTRTDGDPAITVYY